MQPRMLHELFDRRSLLGRLREHALDEVNCLERHDGRGRLPLQESGQQAVGHDGAVPVVEVVVEGHDPREHEVQHDTEAPQVRDVGVERVLAVQHLGTGV